MLTTVGPTQPTFQPTLRPSQLPTFATSYCPPYSTQNTNNAQEYTVDCLFEVCAGGTVTITQSFCNGLAYLLNQDGQKLANIPDNFASECFYSYSFFVTGTAKECFDYTLRQGCVQNLPCSGSFAIANGKVEGTYAPAIEPTLNYYETKDSIGTILIVCIIAFAVAIILAGTDCVDPLYSNIHQPPYTHCFVRHSDFTCTYRTQ